MSDWKLLLKEKFNQTVVQKLTVNYLFSDLNCKKKSIFIIDIAEKFEIKVLKYKETLRFTSKIYVL